MDPLLNNGPLLYFACSADGTVRQVNETFCSALGFSREEVEGKKSDLFFPVATRIFFQTHFFPLLKMQGYAKEIYISLQAKNSEQLPLLMNAERKPADGLIHCMGIVVHNRKKFEDELVAARKAAESALRENTGLQQMKEDLQKHAEQLEQHMRRTLHQHEELIQFNRVVTHDLQEPIRKISIFGNMLESVSARGEDPKPYVEKVLRSLVHMRSIVSGLQQYVWISETAVQHAPVHPEELFLEAAEQVKKENPGVVVEVETEGLREVAADKAQLQVMLYQLLDNAIRFRKEEGPVRIKLSGTVLQKNRFVAVKEKYRYEDQLRLQLSDNGIGFDPVFREEAFRLFGRLHDRSGRGVGLAICKKIMDNHHGSIHVDSIPGSGSTFSIFLPMQNV